MSNEIDNLVAQIVQAIDVAISADSNAESRMKANTFIEEVKCGLNDNFEQNFAIAFKLLNYAIEKPTSPVDQITFFTKQSNINNFGLQIMELMVKFNWNKLSQNCKDELKIMLENIICKVYFSSSTLAQIYENRLLKDQVSRLIVEILMREWPQQWPGFLPACLNQPKNELVLYTFWRLSENIGVFFLPNNGQRRRDMNNELTVNLDHILEYIADCLALDNTNLTILALQTLCSFFEWSTFKPDALTFLCKVLTIEMNDTHTLVKILNNVADCFFTVLNRKTYNQEDKKVLLVFFEEQNLTVLIAFLEKLLPFVQHKIENKVIDEKTFDLVKRVCDVFSLMGQMCITICHQFNLSVPATWPVYLQVMLTLLEYDNQIYNYYSLQFWKDLFRNQHLKDNNISEAMFMKIINILPYKMVKKEEMNNIFLVYEFDGSADYDVFFSRFRNEFGEFLRSLTKYNEKLCFGLAISITKQALESKSDNKHEWSTIASILDSVCNHLTNADQFSEEALPILKFMINLPNVDDPELMSIMISSLSALSVFMQYSKEDMFKPFLAKTFSMISDYSYSPEPRFLTRNKSIRELRRHVYSLFIRLSIRFTKSLLPLFDMIKDYIFTLAAKPEVELTQLDKISLFEGLLVLSNNFIEPHLQTEFILLIVKPAEWLIQYTMSTADFVRHIGLTSPQSEWETYSTNRMSLIYAVNIILVIIRRVNRKNVLLPAFLPYIASLTKLIKNLNEMWTPEIRQLCFPDYRELIYSPLLDTERLTLLETFMPGIKQQQQKKEDDEAFYNLNRMQTFLWLLHENCYIAIGSATNLIGLEFYSNLETIDLIYSINHLPDFKFKQIFKNCMRPIIQNCPKNQQIYESKIFPLFYKFLPAFFEKINQKWDEIKRLRDSDQDEANHESEQFEKEVIEEQICRQLSKEFFDVLNILMIEKGLKEEEEKLSELGIYFLSRIPDLIYMAATLMTWLDSVISMKATVLTTKIIDKLAEGDILKSSNSISYLIKQVLIALGYFGEHDQNQAILLNLFIKLYENYVIPCDLREIKTQLVDYSGKNIRHWNGYAEKMSQNTNLKKRREAIKNLLNNVIGKNLSQLFKQQGKEEIRNLTPLLSRAERNRREDKPVDPLDDDPSDTFWKFF